MATTRDPQDRNLKAVIEYDGTRYLGWQVQVHGPTIQGEMEAALAAVAGQSVRVTGSGRTDAGVHAVGQVANFRVSSSIPTDRFAAALNAHLPRDIAVRTVEEVSADFHARFDARAKHYTYTIVNRRCRPALDRDRVHHVAPPLDTDRMAEAARVLVGRQDFRSFATVDPLRRDRCAVRDLFEARVTRTGALVRLDFVAAGFLYNMARCLAGTLVQVGLGKWDVARVSRILAAADRREAGPTLPASGLTLIRVYYESDEEVALLGSESPGRAIRHDAG